MKLLLTMNLPYMRNHGGANKSNKSIAESFAMRGCNVTIVAPVLTIPSSYSCEDYLDLLTSFGTDITITDEYYYCCYNGVNIYSCIKNEEIHKLLQSLIKKTNPDWIFVSSEDPSQSLFKAAIDASPDNIIYLAHTKYFLPFGPLSFYPGEKRTQLIGKSKAIVTISKYVADYIGQYSNLNVFVNHPPQYGIGEFLKLGRRSNQYVLMVNPCEVKGISIVLGLAKLMPSVSFAVVPSWGTTSSDLNRLKEFKNISIWKSTSNLDDLFEDVSILLVPSIWEEGFGMIVIDALARGVPVISSNLGGLPEAKLGTGYQIHVNPVKAYLNELDERGFPKIMPPFQDLIPWVNSINDLLNSEALYEKESVSSRINAKKFIESLSIQPLLDYLHELKKSNSSKTSLFETLSNTEKKLLVERYRNQKSIALDLCIPVLQRKDYYDVSYSQSQILITDEMSKEYYGSIIGDKVELKGVYDISILKCAFAEVVKRHEAFRTKFVKIDGQFKQVILDEVALNIEDINLENSFNRDEEISRIFHEVFNTRFDLSAAPLLRIKIIKFDENRYSILFSMHHIISDGLSLEIFYNEVIEFYKSLLTGSPISLPELKFQYKDYACWQKDFFSKSDSLSIREYWHNLFKGNIPRLNLPLDFTRPPVKKFKGKRLAYNLSSSQIESLEGICKKYEVTNFIFLLSIVKILLYKYTHQNELIIGTPVSGRKQEILRNQIGYYVNMIALKSFIDGNKTYESYLTDLKNVCLEGYKNEEYPFEKLVEEIESTNDKSYSPVFDVMVSMKFSKSKILFKNNTDDTDVAFNGGMFDVGSTHDISFLFIRSSHLLSLNIVYSTELFEEKKIHALSAHFSKILDSVMMDSTCIIDHIDIISEDEKQRLLHSHNSARDLPPVDSLIHSQFEEIVRLFPNNIACSYYDHSITYFELNQKANLVATVLRNKGVTPNDIVSFIGYRSIDSIVCILGILKSGGCYTAIEPSTPISRIQLILANSKCKFLLNSRMNEFSVGLGSMVSEFWVDFNELNVKIFENPSFVNTPNDLAYIIYTSGSTGDPKGVMVQHDNVIRLFFPEQQIFDFNEDDRWTLFHSLSFDFSVWEIFGSLLFGGSLYIVSTELMMDTFLFREFLRKEKITILNQVPGSFYRLNDVDLTEPGSRLHLRYIIFGGDVLEFSKLFAWKLKYPNTRLINMYGITETTVHVTYKEISLEDINTRKCNIGKPIPTTTVYILDQNKNLVPFGVTGEIHVGGAGLSRGYLNDNELTARKFISGEKYSEKRLYCSGDLGRYLSNGDIEYVGRSDNQVQIRGYRVELNEIQHKISSLNHVRDVIVSYLSNDIGDGNIVAYILSHKDQDYITGLRKELQAILPLYMIPSYFIKLDEIPLTKNGKIDAKSLPLPNNVLRRIGSNPPSNELEQRIKNIWELVLKFSEFGVDDNFFEIGGHSLKAFKVASLIQNEFSIEIKLGDFFESPTIKALADYIQIVQNSKKTSDLDSNEIEIIL